MIYCIEIWGNAKLKYIDTLKKTMKKIIRILTNSKSNAHTDTLFKQLDILPFEKLVNHRIGILMYTINSGCLPQCLNSLFTTNNSIHDHYTRANNHLRNRKGKSESIYSTFSYQGIYIWNVILTNININVSFVVFKKN